jgi:hypothetical protein
MRNFIQIVFITSVLFACVANDSEKGAVTHGDLTESPSNKSEGNEFLCDETVDDLAFYNYHESQVPNLIIRQNTALNSDRLTDVLVWATPPSMEDWQNNVRSISFIVQVPATLDIEEIHKREITEDNNNCDNEIIMYDLKFKQLSTPKTGPSLETFTFPVSTSEWQNVDFFEVRTYQSGSGKKKKVVAANTNTQPEPAPASIIE